MKNLRLFLAIVFLCTAIFAIMPASARAAEFSDGNEALRPGGRFLTAVFVSLGKPIAVVCDGIFQGKFVTQPKKQLGLLASSPEFAVDRLVYAGRYSFSNTPGGEYTPELGKVGAIQDWSIRNPWFNFGKLGAATGASLFFGYGISWFGYGSGLSYIQQAAFMVGSTALEGAIFGQALEFLPN
jgi:hypothetical protein